MSCRFLYIMGGQKKYFVYIIMKVVSLNDDSKKLLRLFDFIFEITFLGFLHFNFMSFWTTFETSDVIICSLLSDQTGSRYPRSLEIGVEYRHTRCSCKGVFLAIFVSDFD